ncbi:hypothetical protein D1BOALGB6SA_6772 [Olavius sp. associated proteobacterium Delta 1]|nr:hypothetical protein D1BOALGB6SA_6772 [Olavius sp. associated proteobacterium Delta 1]
MLSTEKATSYLYFLKEPLDIFLFSIDRFRDTTMLYFLFHGQ